MGNKGYEAAKAANQGPNMDISKREIPTIGEKPDNPGEPAGSFTSSGWGGGSADKVKSHAAVVKTKTMGAPKK